jgi:ribosomal protein S18 acetylase RimI-like enzyme
MVYKVRPAIPADGDGMLGLMPRLSAFDIPENRNPEHLWRDDANLLREWIAGRRDDCLVNVAEDDSGSILGLTLARLRPEPLSREPSAHLEAIAVAKESEGKGIGQALLAAAEEDAGRHGARTMTLHVISTNTRARRFYERSGYDGELIRYIKPIVASSASR